MRRTIHRLVDDVVGADAPDGALLPLPIVEFGARRIETQRHIPSIRDLVGDRAYVASDIQADDGIDLAQDLTQLAVADGSIGTALVLETVEHVDRPWEAMDEIYRCLRPGGIAIITTVFFFPVHGYPSDYWRFTDHGLEVLLSRFDAVEARIAGSSLLPHTAVAVAGRDPVDEATFGRLVATLDDWVEHRSRSWKEVALMSLPPLALAAAYRAYESRARSLWPRKR